MLGDSDPVMVENAQIEKLLTPNQYVELGKIKDTALQALLRNVFKTFKLEPSKRSAALFENYAESLGLQNTSLSQHLEEQEFFQRYMSAKETHRFQVVDLDEDVIRGTHVPLLEDTNRGTISEIDNKRPAQASIQFPMVNYRMVF